MTMCIPTKDICIVRGTTYEMCLTWKEDGTNPTDLTNYTAEMQIKTDIAAASPELTLTDSNGITLGEAAGTIDILITDTQSELPGLTTDGVYDVVLTDTVSGTVTMIIQGIVEMHEKVTT